MSLFVLVNYCAYYVSSKYNYFSGAEWYFNPLNPDDALKHNFASLKSDLFSWKIWVL